MRVLFLIIFTSMLFMHGCATLPVFGVGGGNLPIVMALDELNQPYKKIGRIQISRTVYFADYAIPQNLQAWGIQALREEAGKLNADALILPEVTSKQLDIIVFPAFPATEYTATGVAIKFNR